MEITRGGFVWFWADESARRVGLVAGVGIGRGRNRIAVLWERKGDSYALAELTPERVAGPVDFPSACKARKAARAMIRRVRSRKVRATAAAVAAARALEAAL